MPPDVTPETRAARTGGDFAETMRAIMTLPLTAEEKAEAVRRMLDEGEGMINGALGRGRAG